MSSDNHVATHTFIAANDFRSLMYRVVDVGGDLSVANGTRAVGIVNSQPNSGQHGTAVYLGFAKAVAGAAITTPGYPLTTAATGFVIAAVSGSHVIGRYMPPSGAGAAASGDLVRGLFNFANARPIGAGSGYV